MVEYIRFTVKLVVLMWVIIAYGSSFQVMQIIYSSDANLSKKDRHMVNIVALTAPISVLYILIAEPLAEED